MANGAMKLENRLLRLEFGDPAGSIVTIRNELTGETYRVSGDRFSLVTEGYSVSQADMRMVSVHRTAASLRAEYRSDGCQVDVTYSVGRGNAFVEKRVDVAFDHATGLKSIVVSDAEFAAPGLRLVAYRYPRFLRPVGGEPLATFFGRTPKGGLYAGIELPFDASSLTGAAVHLAYNPSLKLKEGQRLAGEPMYIGVYKRNAADDSPPQIPELRSPGAEALHRAFGAQVPVRPKDEVLPLPSESEAMVALTSAVLGPSRHGLTAMANGWNSEMCHDAWPDDAALEADLRSLDVVRACGLNWMTEAHAWGGEVEQMERLVDDQHFKPSARTIRFLKYAKKIGLNIMMFPKMNNAHPWWVRKPLRPDHPEWVLEVKDPQFKPPVVSGVKGNCMGVNEFRDWLTRITEQAFKDAGYQGWGMDGSFYGDGGWVTTVIPVECASDKHDHLAGDANYACESALTSLTLAMRKRFPDMLIFTGRPQMDLGVWAQRGVDVCFTVTEQTSPVSNIAAADESRRWGRVRLQHDFMPSYMDHSVLFAPEGIGGKWQSQDLDYLLISALSSAPNILCYLPTKSGIPDADKAVMRKWLDWGRKNVKFLQVRKDLPQWPGFGKVDGSAHVVGGEGLIFLFNPSKSPQTGEFTLSEESIGLRAKGTFSIREEYPQPGRDVTAGAGEKATWDVRAEGAVVLRIRRN